MRPAPVETSVYPDVVFFSRGRGRGHASNDLAVCRALRAMHQAVEVAFVSYDEGAKALKEAGENVVDLLLPEVNPFPETLVRCFEYLQGHGRPIVVAHEELAALSAGRLAHCPTYFLTHWFPSPSDPYVQALEHADGVLFMERPGLFMEPKEVEGKVTYVGPIVREMSHRISKEEAQKSLGLDRGEKLLLVLPGSWQESKAPIFELVTAAFAKLPDGKHLLWVAGRDYFAVKELAIGKADITVIESHQQLEVPMIASDCVITKGTYNVGRELLSLGIPAIALSNATNRIDDLYVRSFPNHKHLWTADIDATGLSKAIREKWDGNHQRVGTSRSAQENGVESIAAVLQTILLGNAR